MVSPKSFMRSVFSRPFLKKPIEELPAEERKRQWRREMREMPEIEMGPLEIRMREEQLVQQALKTGSLTELVRFQEETATLRLRQAEAIQNAFTAYELKKNLRPLPPKRRGTTFALLEAAAKRMAKPLPEKGERRVGVFKNVVVMKPGLLEYLKRLGGFRLKLLKQIA